MKIVFNVLAICGAASFCGVMLSIGVTLGGYWRSLPPAEFLRWFEANNQFVAHSVPIVVLPAMVGLAGSIWMSRSTPSFVIWAVSGALLVAVLVLTVAYFVPTNSAFAGGDIEVEAVAAKLDQWLRLHIIRVVLALASAAFGVIALTR